jgi:hypothetical protein
LMFATYKIFNCGHDESQSFDRRDAVERAHINKMSRNRGSGGHDRAD